MKLFAIRRPERWATVDELRIAAGRARRADDDELVDDVRWIRSYVLLEEDGSLGTICIYEAASSEQVREHARRADLPVTELLEVIDKIVIRPDPVGAWD